MKRIIDEDDDGDIEHYLFSGYGRLILDTIHGRIAIDIRGNDVNAFVIDEDGRKDFLLIPKKED